jgi:hypothetical protein
MSVAEESKAGPVTIRPHYWIGLDTLIGQSILFDRRIDQHDAGASLSGEHSHSNVPSRSWHITYMDASAEK